MKLFSMVMVLGVLAGTAKAEIVSGILAGKEEVLIKTKIQGQIQQINFSEGQRVKEGDVLVVLDDEQQKLELELAKVEYETAKEDYIKTGQLKKYVSQEEILQKKNNYLRKKTVYELKNVSFENTRMTAPIGGVLSRIFIKKGESVGSGEKAFEIINPEDLVIELDIAADKIGKLKTQDQLNFSSEQEKGKSYKGTISYISPVIDKTSGTVRIKLELKNPTDAENKLQLKPGTLVNVEI
ncbi:MAG: efflux RND transporter periplasmic adaptor subunit [Bdellovibrio sp.]|nr:efflux RND transporter periplasmic adaptor subunit [Bdellovibrio sp.]